MNRKLRDNEKYIFTSSYKYFFNFSRNKIFPFLLISSVKIISLKIIKNIKKLSAVVKIKICHNRKIIDFFQSGKRRWPSKFSTLLTHWFCGGMWLWDNGNKNSSTFSGHSFHKNYSSSSWYFISCGLVEHPLK